MRVLYLHGFASGPASKKAVYLRGKLEDSGATVAVPDLNVPDFFNMTLSMQLEHARAAVENLGAEKDPLLIIGSSMGGLLATIYAARHHVDKLCLLAPGFGITSRWKNLLGSEDGLVRWEENGSFDFMHYAHGKMLPLSYNFVRDLQSYSEAISSPGSLRATVDTIVFHGRGDLVVPFDNSAAFACNNRDNTILHPLDDGHELTESLPSIWTTLRNWL